ncbi:MAG: response regulator [Bacillota bacterium]
MYRMMIVEDEELERMVLRKQLEDSNLPIKIVGEAANGKEALRLVDLVNPQIVLMDIKMPGMDGLEATKLIKEKNNDIEIVIITAYSIFSYSSQAIKLRAADYLLKPVRPEELIAAINRVISFIREKPGRLSENFDEKDKASQKDDDTKKINDNLLINQIKEHINDNYAKRLTLNDLAEVVHYNPSYISSLFKKHTGHGVIDYITEVRLNKAKQLLLDTSSSMDEIAYLVGLNNNSYFTALFKKKEGMNPSEYRRFFAKSQRTLKD